jgi:hypothetical protein
MRADVLLQFIETGKWFDYGPLKTIVDKRLLGVRPTEAEKRALSREFEVMKRYIPERSQSYLVPTIPEGLNSDELKRELKQELVDLIRTSNPFPLVHKINDLNIPYRIVPWSDAVVRKAGSLFGEFLRGQITVDPVIVAKIIEAGDDPHKLADIEKSLDPPQSVDPVKPPDDWIIVQDAPVEDFKKAIYLILGQLLEAGFHRYLHKCQQCGILFLSKRVGPGVGKFCGSQCTTAWHNQMKLKDKDAWAKKVRLNRERQKKEIKQTLSIFRSFPRRHWMNKLKRKFPNKTDSQLEKLVERCKAKI